VQGDKPCRTFNQRRAVALRIGWVARDEAQVAAADAALRADYWDTPTLIAYMRAALAIG